MPKDRIGKLASALLFALLPSCNTPEGVAKFSSSAVVTLKAGDSLFDDMKASCLRDAQTFEPFGAFAVSDPNPAACDDIGKQAEGLKAASNLVSGYFTALREVASIGTSQVGDDAKSQAARATAEARLSAARQTALESVAGFLVRAAESGYRQKHLAEDIGKVHNDIKAVLDGLGEAVGVVYLQQLQDEEQKTAARYKEFLLQHPGSADTILALDARWQADRANFAARQRAARSFQAALAAMAKGNEDLTAHARRVKAQDLSGLLAPYAAQLDALAPAIQKAFF